MQYNLIVLRAKGGAEMTFQQLIYIVEVSKCGSINKAAHKLYLSQSGLSASIKELEDELNIRLFDRSNRGVVFTQEGKEFLSYAVSLLEHKQRIESLYGNAQNISAPQHFSVSTQRYPFSEAAFLKLLDMMPDQRLQYNFRETGMDAVIDDVFDHRADIGVIFITEATQSIIMRLLASRELVFHELASVAPCVFVRHGHPLAKKDRVEEADLAGYPYVSFEQAQGVSVDLAEEFRVVSMNKPSRCIIVNNRSTLINILAKTDAFTTGSGLLMKGISPESIITVPIACQEKVRLGWIFPDKAKPSQITEQFINNLEQAVRESIEYTASIQKELSEGGNC